MRKKKLEAVLAKLEQQQAALGSVLMSSPGRKLLEVLEAEFVEGDLFGETPEETAFNLGSREVVLTLRRLARAAQRTGDVIDAGER